METIQVKCKEASTATDLPTLGGLDFSIKNPAGNGPFHAVVTLGGYFTTPVPVKTKNGNTLVYPAASLTDISTAGKTAIASISAAGNYLFVTSGNAASDVITFVQTPSISAIIAFSQDACTVENSWIPVDGLSMWPYNKSTSPNIYSPIHFKNKFNLQKPPRYNFSDIIKSDVVFNLANMADTTTGGYYPAITGGITPEQKTIVESSGIINYNVVTLCDDYFQLDLSHIPSNTLYCKLVPAKGGVVGMNILCSGAYSDLWLKTKVGSKQLNILVPCGTGVIDKLISAAAENPDKTYSFSIITLKGVRTSASDAALATLQAAGVTVNIVAP